MSCASRRDYVQRIYPRYHQASWAEKQGILDEFCANCDYNRKYAIRVLNGPAPAGKPVRKQRRRRGVTYGSRVISILKAVWEAANYPWSVRLKALLAGMDALDWPPFPAHAGDRAATAPDQRPQHRLPAGAGEAQGAAGGCGG